MSNKVKIKQSVNTREIKAIETLFEAPQKVIRNECLQSLEVYFIDKNDKVDSYWLQPKEMIKIPATGVTHQLKLLQERRMIRISNN